MKNKKAVAAFWWVFISILAVVVFAGVYILFSGTYINDFWRYGNQGNGVIEAGQTSGSTASGSSNTGSGGSNASNTNNSTWGSIFNNTSSSTSNLRLSFLPSPPPLPG